MHSQLFFVFGFVFCAAGINAKAETRQERYKRLQYESDQKFLDELEEAGMLTQEAIDAIDGPNSTRKPNYRSSNGSSAGSKGNSNSAGTTQGKGWIYSSDELHVIGLPEGSNGYAKTGYYGDVDKSYSSGYSGAGKGWVYDADELHVIGLLEGEDGYTMSGYYGDID